MIKFTKPNVQRLSLDRQAGVTLENIPIDKIQTNPYQPRKVFSEEALVELANSIRTAGLLQPVTVRKMGMDGYELIAGERRTRACKMARYTHIRALVMHDAIDQDSAMIAMIENLQRENLHFFEEAEGYQALIREHGFTQEELARRLSKNQSTIANKLRILRLPRVVKDRITYYALTERHARALLRLHNEEAQLKLVERIGKQGLSVKATEDLVQAELQCLYGEEKEERGNLLRIKCGYKIYLNTLRKTVKKINAMGANASVHTVEKQDCVEILVTVSKTG